MLEVLRRLSPGERVSFVLHDVFQMPFDEIAETVGRPVGTCRQLARRARAKFSDASPRLADVADAEHQLVTEKFITACANGDLQALTARAGSRGLGCRHHPRRAAPPPQINHGPTTSAAICCATSATARRSSAGRSVSRCCWPSPIGDSSPSSCSRCATTAFQDRGDASTRRQQPDRSVVRRRAGRRAYSVVAEFSSLGGISTVSIMYTCALAVWTPPHTTDASLTLRSAAHAGDRHVGALHGLVSAHDLRGAGLARHHVVGQDLRQQTPRRSSASRSSPDRSWRTPRRWARRR